MINHRYQSDKIDPYLFPELSIMTKDNAKEIKLLTDIDTFKSQVDIFVEHHRNQQNSTTYQNQLQNATLAELIKKAPLLPDSAIEVFFQIDKGASVSTDVMDEVHTVLKEMQSKVNGLPAQKRFFILETVNFFSSKISIGKLIPALLVMKGEDQKKAICEFIFPTFFNINKNIEILVANDRLFDPKTLHIERGILYTFVSDLAKALVPMFNKEFVARVGDVASPIEFLLSVCEPGSMKISSAIDTKSQYVWEEMIDNESELRAHTLKFISMIQSHDALHNYSLKRHLYYKSFLMNLTRPGKFAEIEPIDISRILAGCLVANGQLMVEDELVDNMIDEEQFDQKSTVIAKKQLIDQLTPSTILKLITRVKTSLQQIARADFAEEFGEVQKMSVKTILKSVWSGFVQMVEKGLSAATEPIYRVVEAVKNTYKSFLKEEREEEQDLRDSVNGKKAELTYRIGDPIPKNLESFAIMTQHFNMVEPSIIGFRGEHEGASHKDFGLNSRVFNKDQNLMICYFDVLKKLFAALKNNPKVKEISFEKQSRIKEYSVSYMFGKFMLSLGISHIRMPNALVIDEKDLFPYALLFKETDRKNFGSVLAREVHFNNEVKVFSEAEFRSSSSMFYYEPLYLILHLLPEKDWKSKSNQAVIGFLVSELQKFKKKSGSLLYCVNLPTLTS